MLNDLYAAAFLQLYRVWKRQRKTLADAGCLLKGTFPPRRPLLTRSPAEGPAAFATPRIPTRSSLRPGARVSPGV